MIVFRETWHSPCFEAPLRISTAFYSRSLKSAAINAPADVPARRCHSTLLSSIAFNRTRECNSSNASPSNTASCFHIFLLLQLSSFLYTPFLYSGFRYSIPFIFPNKKKTVSFDRNSLFFYSRFNTISIVIHCQPVEKKINNPVYCIRY